MTKGLVNTAKGAVYQIWAMAGSDKPVSMGTFRVDENGRAHIDFLGLSQKKDYSQFAVTLEQAGGAKIPTGPVQLLGKF